jgi:hypothetical protein
MLVISGNAAVKPCISEYLVNISVLEMLDVVLPITIRLSIKEG